MKKQVFLIIGVFIWITNLFGQDSLEYYLTVDEVKFIQSIKHISCRDSIDMTFNNKKVAFFTGPGGTEFVNKSNFFNGGIPFDNYISIIKFTERQKGKHSFDYAIIFESKNSYPKISNKLKRIIKEKQN